MSPEIDEVRYPDYLRGPWDARHAPPYMKCLCWGWPPMLNVCWLTVSAIGRVSTNYICTADSCTYGEMELDKSEKFEKKMNNLTINFDPSPT